MGFRFRKSKKIGPFRVTASKSGISTSFGVKGARITRTAKGKTRVSASLPGTGLGWSQELGSGKKVAPSKQNAEKGEKPKMKKRWIIIAVIVVLAAIGAGNKDKTTTVEPTPTPAAEEKAVVRSMPVPAETEAPELLEISEPDPTPPPEPTPTPRMEHTYIMNVNTGVVHIQGCRFEKQMKDSNKKEIVCTRDELIAAGYNLCDTCNP